MLVYFRQSRPSEITIIAIMMRCQPWAALPAFGGAWWLSNETSFKIGGHRGWSLSFSGAPPLSHSGTARETAVPPPCLSSRVIDCYNSSWKQRYAMCARPAAC